MTHSNLIEYFKKISSTVKVIKDMIFTALPDALKNLNSKSFN
jgi:hypothetical protein